MNAISPSVPRRRLASWRWLRRIRQPVTLFFLLVLFPALALAQSGSPFDTGFTALQTLFTGTVAKVASLRCGKSPFTDGAWRQRCENLR
jgi:type IV secretion system protein VirB2